MSYSCKNLVVGCGNILFKDDGFGPRVIEALNEYFADKEMPEDTKFVDGGVGAPQMSPKFVPVIFDDEEEQEEELTPNGTREIVGDGCVYDLMGRKVATREQVEDGSWKQRVATGIYIINGKKIRK